MMKTLRNEKGFALAFVIILAAIALVFTFAMLSMVSRGSFVSGQQKLFRTAVEASHGGVDAMLQLISERGAVTTPFPSQWVAPGIGTKLSGPIATWTGLDNSFTIDPLTLSTYDMRIQLGSYLVYSKIVDTMQGNSGADLGLRTGGVSSTGSGEVIVVSIPYLYTIEVLSQGVTNPTERSKISVLFEY